VDDVNERRPPSAARYEGLDLLRGISVFSVAVLHVHVLSGGGPRDAVLLVRDFAFPILLMGSFFVLAVSFDRRPLRPFGELVRARIVRLLVPSVVWSYLYWIGWWMVRPWLKGESGVFPPWSLVLTAYLHLWFLHLVFAMTVAFAPVLGWVARGRWPRWPVFGVCLAAAIGSLGWLQPLLLEMTSVLDAPARSVVAYPAPDWLTCVDRIAPFLAYAPLGLAIGLARGAIDRWYRTAAFRVGTIVAALAALAVHLSPANVPFSREIYSLAVFIAVLRPVPPRPLTMVRYLSRWSFVVYILHFAFAVVLTAAYAWADVAPSALASFGGGVIVFAMALAAGAALRRVLPFDWLLPLVPVGKPVASEVR